MALPIPGSAIFPCPSRRGLAAPTGQVEHNSGEKSRGWGGICAACSSAGRLRAGIGQLAQDGALVGRQAGIERTQQAGPVAEVALGSPRREAALIVALGAQT